jgi:hypothetical protein
MRPAGGPNGFRGDPQQTVQTISPVRRFRKRTATSRETMTRRTLQRAASSADHHDAYVDATVCQTDECSRKTLEPCGDVALRRPFRGHAHSVEPAHDGVVTSSARSPAEILPGDFTKREDDGTKGLKGQLEAVGPQLTKVVAQLVEKLTHRHHQHPLHALRERLKTPHPRLQTFVLAGQLGRLPQPRGVRTSSLASIRPFRNGMLRRSCRWSTKNVGPAPFDDSTIRGREAFRK